MKIAIFPCIGLGDGLIALVLANNLVKAGHTVEVFHPLLPKMQPLFPKVFFAPRPTDLQELTHDKWIFFYEKLDWMQQALQANPEKNVILNPIATPNRDYPFYEEGEFDGTVPFVKNLVQYAKNKWGIEDANQENGITLPADVQRGKYPRRVILHPTSSRAGKNWSKDKFLALAKKLQKEGFDPVFILSEKEREGWPEAPRFPDLCSVAHFVAESGFMIGNDSGIGHLASCLGVPTLTICRNRMSADFWRPAWANGEVIVPPKWIPNLKGLRWRDKKWQAFVPVGKVFRSFSNLREASVLRD
ncbi:MAG: glycosyltransferase family 9 protein [Simkaniaceae bacterium]|nr:glycosyltransferase family 9 protein [Candidatus Sacchlamyda saccharinae]